MLMKYCIKVADDVFVFITSLSGFKTCYCLVEREESKS